MAEPPILKCPECAAHSVRVLEQARLWYHADTFQCEVCGHLWEPPRQIISPPSKT
jgi:rubredoxin